MTMARADTHTRVVGWLKVALPLAALAILSTLFLVARRIDPEAALRGTNAKFTRRFRAIEAALAAQGKRPEASDLAEMDALWDAAKAAERAS